MRISRHVHKLLKIRTVLLLVNFTIIVVIIASLNLLTIYENTLIRQTEAELNSQAYFISAILKQRQKLAAQTTNTQQADWSPVAAVLDLSNDPIQALEPDLIAGSNPLSINDKQLGLLINPILKEAQRFALSSIQVLNPDGTVIGSTNTDQIGRAMHNRKEVREALHGEHQSLLRARVVKHPDHVFSSISRSGSYRVHIVHPVKIKQQVIAAIVVSRTPKTLWQILLLNKSSIISYILLVILMIWAVSIATALAINRPIAELIKQAQRALNGEKDAIKPLEHPITEEVNTLSVTLAKLSKSLEQRSEYILEFASHVSHEFKTPVTSIQGAVELLLDHHDTMTPAELKKFLGNLQKDSIRLENLVHRLLEFARADYKIAPGKHCALAPLLNNLQSQYHNKQTSVTIQSNILENTHIALADEILQSIMENLISNAQQAHATEIHITATLNTQHQYMEINVADNGDGISTANAEKIFTPFFTTKRDKGGTGLGLSIIRSLLQQANGSIELKHSKKETGTNTSNTTFTLRLPIM
ncbi:MAG: HAMP domain-containing histidine kinase [Pseudomonadales bacterium]|nr:HAMP domain-containing histidine kinase [Pseudomonadales bacterium]